MKSIYTIENFAKRLVMVLTAILMVGNAWSADFFLVKDASSLTVGDHIIIVNADNGYAISTTQNTNNRAATSVSASNEKITPSASVEVLTLGAGTTESSYWTLCTTGSKYLYAAASGANRLKSQDNVDVNAEWDITIDASGNATIIAEGSSNRNEMNYNYNSGSPIFSCYSSGGTLHIYKQGSSTFTVDFAVSPAGYGTVSPSAQLTGIASGTAITTSSNTITINGTTVTATPHAQDADYNYAFSSWSVTDNLTTVTKNITVTANFSRTPRAYKNYRTACCSEWSAPSISGYSTSLTAGGATTTIAVASGTTYGARTFQSSDEAVLEVNSSGVITPRGAGTATVTVSWAGDATHCAEEVTTSTITVTGNVTVTFKKNGGGGTDSQTQSIPYSTSTSLTSLSTLGLTAPSCKEFYGWADSQEKADAGTRDYSDGQSVTLTASKTLYAVWKDITYTVSDGTMVGVASHSYVSNPITCGSTLSITCAADGDHKGNPTVTATGTHGDITVVSATSVTIANVTSAITVSISYAAKENYTVTLNPGNGSLSATGSWSKSGDNLTQTVLEGNNVTAMPTPTPGCSGWAFVGWKQGSAANNQASFTPDKTAGATFAPTANVTYYAVYQRQSAPSGTSFTKITGTSNLVTGNYQFSSGNYAMKNEVSGDRMAEVSGYSSSDAGHTVSDDYLIWKIIKFDTQVAIMNGDNYLGIDGDNNICLTTTPQFFTYEYNTVNSRWEFTSVTNSSYQLIYGGSPNYYRMGTAQGNAIALYQQDAGLSGNYYSSPTCDDYTVTGVANPVEGGSVTLSATSGKTGDKVYALYTVDPAYNFENWSVSGSGATLSSTTAQMTEITVGSANVTVTANFTAKVMYTVTWKVNNANYTTGTPSSSAESGSAWSTLTLPTAPDNNTLSACERTKFMGWSTSQLTGDGQSAPSDLFKSTSDANATSHTITGNTTFYAVFAKGGADGSWALNGSNLSCVSCSSTGYAKYEGDHEALSGIRYKTYNVMVNGSNLQIKQYAYIKNYDAMPADITSIQTGDLDVYVSSSAITSTAGLTKLEPDGLPVGGIYTYSITGSNRFFYIYKSSSGTIYPTVTINYEGAGTDYVTSCACSWQINYITNGKKDGDGAATWSEDNCFVQVEDTHEWQIENFAMPNVAGQFWVGPGSYSGHSAIEDLSNIKYVLRNDKSRTSYSAVSNMIGTLNIWDNSGDNNYYPGIYPDYQITYGVDGGGSWAKVDFNYISGTTYETDVVTAPTYFAVANFKYYVGVKTDGNTGYGGKSNTAMMNTMSGMTSNQDGRHGKWRMYEDSGDPNWYCAWIPYYVLSYDANGGTGAPSAEAAVSSEGDAASRTKTVSSTVPTRDGYTFLGWAESTAHATAGTVDYTAGNNIILTADKTIYAVWAQNFTVTYDLDGGTASPACLGGTYYVGQSVTVCSTTPTKTSSSFLGWKRLDTGATVAGGSSFSMPSNNVTIQAQWETVYYHIYYKEEDGTAIATDDVPQTMETTLRNQTPCVGYTFFGWSTSKITTETTTKPTGVTFIGKGGASYTPTSDITVYPVYARSEGATTVKDTLTSSCVGSGTGYRSFTNFQHHSDAKYSGWASIGNSSIQMSDACGIVTTTSGGKLKHVTIKYNSKTGVDRSVDLYGQNSNYSNVTAAMSIPTGTKIGTATKTTAVNYEQTFELPSSGSDFDTEYEDLAIKCTYGAAYVEQVIVTWGTGTYYYATHCETKTEVTVTYDANGGTTTCGDGEHKVTWAYKNGGVDAPELEEPQTICSDATRDGGYILREWTTNADGTGTQYAPSATVTSLNDDIILYAQWDRVYTITFNNQGVTTPVTQASAGASVAVPSATAPCEDPADPDTYTWAFVGWSKTAIAPMSFLPELEITAGTSTYTPDEDVTLYAIYRKTSTSSAFVAGMSGAYKITNGSTVYAGACNSSKLPETDAAGAAVFYIKYTSAGGGKYTIQQADGKYLKYAGESTSLALDDETPYYWTMTQNGDLWHVLGVGSGRYLQYSSGTGFKAYNTSGYTDIAFVAAEGQYYYRTMSCASTFNITYHENGTTINWADGHPVASYKNLADGTVVSTFPTATYSGWTFLGWRSSEYTENTSAPASPSIHGGSDGTSGNPLTIASADVDLYPVFTRFEDNEQIDLINGGDYYIYFLDSTQTDEYGAYKRVYATGYAGNKRYFSTALCSAATEFTFTKLPNGNWTIKDKATGHYLYGAAGDDDLRQQASATGAEWTLTVHSGNELDAFHVGTEYGQITAFGNGTSATFMNYRRTNIGSNPSYHRVYLGTCTNRTYTTDPVVTPSINIHGQVKVTSTAGKSVKATSVLTVSAKNISTANLTISSDPSVFKFSLSAGGTYTSTLNIPVVSKRVSNTPIYMQYTPTATTDGIEDVIITVTDNAGTPTTKSTEVGDVQGRHLPDSFVIASKLDGKWYALPADCNSSGTWPGVLIEVDDADDPTEATAAPNTKFGMQMVRLSRRADYGSRLVFTEQLTTANTEEQKTLYNGSTTNIQVYAAYKSYKDENPDRYEWIPSTDDLKDYTLTSADGSNTRPLCLSTSGAFGTYTSGQAYDGKVRLLPATFYDAAPMQVLEWKANSVVVMYTGTETSATTQVGDNSASSSQTLSTRKLTHGVYELATDQALTSNDGKSLTVNFGSTKAIVDIPVIITGNANASDGHSTQDVVIVKGGKLTAQSTKYSYHNIYVYGGGKLDVSSGKLGVNNIILRAGGLTTSGIGTSPSATYDYVYPQVKLGGTLTSTKTDIKYEYITDYDHWYHLCLPFNGTLNTITYPQEYYGDNVTAANTGSWIIKRYAGEIRATGENNAWVDIETESATVASAGHGYIFWGAPKKVTIGGDKQRQQWGIQRITMSTTAAAATTAETANKTVSGLGSYSGVDGNSNRVNDQGWNLIGNPYMANLTGLNSESLKTGKLVEDGQNPGHWVDNEDGIRYVTIPSDHFETYEAQTMSSFTSDNPMLAGRTFFVQIDGDATGVTFLTANRAAMAPAWQRNAEADQVVDVETGIVMSGAELSDEVDFWIKDGKTEAYESNADYPKTHNTTDFNIYGVHPSGNLSWVAISPSIAEGDMAIGYQVPQAGDYILSLSEKFNAEEIESLLVTDHGVTPELTTDLMINSYLFTVHQAETNNERFTVSIKVREQGITDVTTDIGGPITAPGDTPPVKFIYDDKLYILNHGILYDATGKRVNGTQQVTIK